MRFADAAELRLDGAEQIERVEMIRRGLEHARVNFLGVAQPALPVQRQGLVERLAEVERAGLRAHRRLIRAMRRVTSAGVSLSALVFSASAARAAGRSRQRVSQAFRFGVADKIHVDGAADDGGDIEIGHGEVAAEQIRLLGQGRVEHLERRRDDFQRLVALGGIALGRRQAHRVQRPDIDAAIDLGDRPKAPLPRLRLAFERAGIERAVANASWRDKA